MTRRSLITLLLTLLTTPLAAQEGLPRVYLAEKAPDASGFVAPGAKERRDVMKELTNSLRDKKKVLILVESADQADVTLELTDAQIGDGSRATTHLNRFTGTVTTAKDKAYLAAVTLKAGDYSTEFTGEGLYPVIAARAITKSVEQWVKENQAQIIAKRAGATNSKETARD